MALLQKKCNGFLIDYEREGNVRMKGFFIKGKAKGTMKYYNADGSLACVHYYSKRGKLIDMAVPLFK